MFYTFGADGGRRSPNLTAEDRSRIRKLSINLADSQKSGARPQEGGLTVACLNDEAHFGKERDLCSETTCTLFVVYSSLATGIQKIKFTAEPLL